MRTLFASFLCISLLAACDSLPRTAAVQNEILSQNEAQKDEFAVYTVNKSLLPTVRKWPRTGQISSYGWIRREQGPNSQIIASDDKLNLQIWDSEENSLLTAPGQKAVQMSEVVVSADGTIFVPYLEKIVVNGLSTDQARETIQKQLAVIIPSAQVQMSLVSGRRNSVDLVGGAARAGNFPLPDRNFSVLNLISMGGGVNSSLRNPQVRLVRDGKDYATSLTRLYENPGMDTILRGGDKVIIEEDRRAFVALGAAGSQKLTYFEKDSISALDAVSMMGGVESSRGDPAAVLILRQYPDRAVKSDNRGPSNARSVFVIDLTSADGLFSAGEFEVYPNDLVLVTESPVNSIQAVFRLIGSAFTISSNI